MDADVAVIGAGIVGLATASGEDAVRRRADVMHQAGATVRIETDARTWSAAAAVVCAGRGTQPLAREAGLDLPGAWRRHTRFSYAPRGEATGWAAWIHSAPQGRFYALPVPGGAYAVGVSGHDGTRVHEQGRVRWVMAVNVAKMAPEVGATLAREAARS